MKDQKSCLPISRDTFQYAPTDTKLDFIYDCLEQTHTEIVETKEHLDKKRKIDTTVSAMTGFLGGFVAFFSTKIFKGF